MAKKQIKSADVVPDVFISYASEDKEQVALPLARRLSREPGLHVWYDDMTLEAGDSLFERINDALKKSRFGIVILSKNFFKKRWPMAELHALWSREVGGEKILIPVWYQVTRKEVGAELPLVVDLLSVSFDDGIEPMVEKILKIIKGPTEGTFRPPIAEDLHANGHPPGSHVVIGEDVREIRSRLDASLKGQYIIEAMLARGESSIVFRARDQNLRRRVAIKALDLTKTTPRNRSAFVKKFHQSMQYAANLEHRNIVKVLTGKDDPVLPYVVLGFVEGVRLDMVIRSTGIQPFRKVRDFLLNVGGALIHAHHQKYIHLNLRPTGIFIDKEGQPVVPPLRFLWAPEAAIVEDEEICEEVLRYQSPEQYRFGDLMAAEPSVSVSALSDQYTLGLIAYEMIIGRPVIETTDLAAIRRHKDEFLRSSPDPRESRPDCPAGLAEVVMRMLKVEPRDRWPHLEDARDALSKIELIGYSPPSEETIQQMKVAMRSYERCRESASFLHDFYSGFFAIHPDVKKKFPMDLEKQYYLLRETLDLILQFPAEQGSGEQTTLTRVAEAHGRRNIPPNLYNSFANILIEVVQTHDPWCQEDPGRAESILDAWKATVKPAIDYMKRL